MRLSRGYDLAIPFLRFSQSAEGLAMQRFLVLGYGIACYGAFLIVFLYTIGFVTNFGLANFAVPKSIDDGPRGELAPSLLIDGLLVGLFAVQHSVMARPAFKRVWTRVVPAVAERSTYVLFTSLALIILFWQWRPLPHVVWKLESRALRTLLWAINAFGWGIVLVSTFLIDHFELFGLRQVFLNFTRQSDRPGKLKQVGLYRLVRHPLMTGFLIAFWATPTMSVGHLFFAATMTTYILIAVQIEERDLLTYFGDEYRSYQGEVGMLVPAFKRTTRP
jgi:methanethiol S-methyltransferase